MSAVIGAEAIDRASTYYGQYCVISKEQPATIGGKVNLVQVFVNELIKGFIVATFYEVSPNYFTSRSHHYIGYVYSGYSEFEVDLDVAIGDYIGFKGTAGKIDRDDFGAGMWRSTSADIPCVNSSFYFFPDYTVSLRGIIPPPPAGNVPWAILDLHYCQNPFQIKVTTYTDIPTHHFLRWSTHQPRRHPMPVLRRGIRIADDIRFCFTVFQDLEQEEGGDTLVHTFYLPVWPEFTTFWYYFFGTVEGASSPSTSAIFKAIRYDPFQWLIAEQWSS